MYFIINNYMAINYKCILGDMIEFIFGNKTSENSRRGLGFVDATISSMSR